MDFASIDADNFRDNSYSLGYEISASCDGIVARNSMTTSNCFPDNLQNSDSPSMDSRKVKK